MRESDIGLLPHSPLALTDVLLHPEGCLDLVPLAPGEAEQVVTVIESGVPTQENKAAPVIHMHQRRRQRHARNRANLLTSHQEGPLLEQCKSALVDNALVKARGLRRLLLVAGFMSWPDAHELDQRQRAPILLYPALLVRKPEQSSYELRMHGASPEINLALRSHCQDKYGIDLPELTPEMPLTDWFAQLAEVLSSVDELQLELEMALGNSTINTEERQLASRYQLPDKPEHFDAGLAISIAGGRNLVELSAILQLIPDYEKAAACEGPEPTVEADSEVHALRDYSARMASEGLDHIEFQHFEALPDNLDRWRETASVVLGTATIEHVLHMPEISSRQMIRLAGIIELIDKAPIITETHAHGDLCFASTTVLLRRAQHQAKLIEDELSALQKHFVMDRIPAKRQLLSLIEELNSSIVAGPDVVEVDYFNARRQFMEFSIDKPAQLTTEHRRLLSQLAKVLRFRELFVNNTEYRAALGPGYRGLRTDWTAMTQISGYARELAEVLESESIAAIALGNWQRFRSAFITDLETLQSAAESTRRLLQVFGTRWQNRPLTELLERVASVPARIQAWNNQFGSADRHGARTPAAVLSQFSGRSAEDNLMAQHVSETRARIDGSLSAGLTDPQRIAGTLAWLRAASDAATEHELDIDVIVDHLNIA